MKILHAADLHLDAPFTLHPPEHASYLRRKQRQIPEQLLTLVRREHCDLVLLAGDLFDGPASRETLDALGTALAEMAVPVFISPGNHDLCCSTSPYLTERWPENVHIFTEPTIRSVSVPQLDCRIYGAGYDAMDCPPLLEGFLAQGQERYHIAVLHGDPTQTRSAYCPITAAQVRESGLDYLALGHIHQGGVFRSGETLCAWPGCAMGRGFDELGEKGVLIVTLGAIADAKAVPLDVPRFHEAAVPAGKDPQTAIRDHLPPVPSEDFFRIDLTGEAEPPDLRALYGAFSQYPHLQLRDRTVPAVDLWQSIDEDTLEGIYFRTLRDAMDAAPEQDKQVFALAARISRQILDGREVDLP